MKIQIQLKGADGSDAWKGALAAIENFGKDLGRTGVRVGIMEGATRSDNGQPIAQYAFYNEFGVPGKIPARPFMRNTIRQKQDAWIRFMSGRLSANFGKNADARAVLKDWETLGRVASTDVQNTIKSGVKPENAESTKKRKAKGVIGGAGGTHTPGTLIDTGEMIKAISYEVVES